MDERPAVYTAIYGSFDQLLEPVEQDIDVDWYCFTDDPRLTSSTWQTMLQPARFDSPRLSAKWPKLLPHEALPDRRTTIWVDANLQIDSPSFVREALGYSGSDIGVFRHPMRYCIYHEAYACLRRIDCRDLPVLDQVRHYREQGHPPQGGLWACGVLVRDSSRADVRALGEAWMDECLKWSPRDQLSFPFLLRRSGIRPRVFPFHIDRSPAWLATARYLGLTPGTFPRHLLSDAEARRLCPWRWFPPVRNLPLQLGEVGWARPPRWRENPWFTVQRHRPSAA
jgi:hypothetical protein